MYCVYNKDNLQTPINVQSYQKMYLNLLMLLKLFFFFFIHSFIYSLTFTLTTHICIRMLYVFVFHTLKNIANWCLICSLTAVIVSLTHPNTQQAEADLNRKPIEKNIYLNEERKNISNLICKHIIWIQFIAW